MNTSRSSLLNVHDGTSRDVSGPPVTAVGCVCTQRGRVCEGHGEYEVVPRASASPSVEMTGGVFIPCHKKTNEHTERKLKLWVFMRNWWPAV